MVIPEIEGDRSGRVSAADVIESGKMERADRRKRLR
jgi:hypothetical protein